MAFPAKYGNWDTMHDLALIYLAFMYGSDGRIDTSETDVVEKKLIGWFPETDTGIVTQVMHEVMLMYISASSDQMLDTIVAEMRQSMSERDRVAVLNDLTDIASADGLIFPGEVTFIEQLAREWDLENYLR